ncbi:MAG: UbiD family decarboxylase [Bacteroidia bacterium]
MGYKSLKDCLIDLERHGHLKRIKHEVDPNLEMSAIHLEAFENKGPAIFYEKVKGSKFPAVSNLFGTVERSKFMFRDTWKNVQELISLKSDPMLALKKPLQHLHVPFTALKALPLKSHFSKPVAAYSCSISDLPQIIHWPKDGGPFVTLPAVYTEDIDKPGIMHANLGMYRIQLGGNAYIQDKEIGLHYQLHRGIGVHQTKSNAKGLPLKVSIFVGGPPSHILSAVMPLPEGMSEMTFAGALNGRRFRYFYDNEGFCISSEADFVITGEVYPNENKPEGPFGDHLGYYSLQHPFPLMKVKNVYHRKDAIWPFTVVGRPPQEDTAFGALIHELTGAAIKDELPGVEEVHAVDASGVHPLLLAIGSERYTPFLENPRPAELLTIANHILGTGQLSLAKWLFIASKQDGKNLSTHDEGAFFRHILERIDLGRDLHFYTNTSIDTLDYSGDGLNSGSKLVLAAVGKPIRQLSDNWNASISLPEGFSDVKVLMAGVICLKGPKFTTKENAEVELKRLEEAIPVSIQNEFPWITLCDDSEFVSQHLNNWLWVTFTRSNPSHDVYGVESFSKNKHWGCLGPLIVDARIKPHHAPAVEMPEQIRNKAKEILNRAGI